jgi:hypothetical protein
LTFDDFMAYWQAPCHWCGYKVRTIGLDRVKSDGGYTKDNVVSSCKYCNMAKSDLTPAQFVALCSNVVRRHGLAYAAI